MMLHCLNRITKTALLISLACALAGCKSDETAQKPKPPAVPEKKFSASPDSLTPEQTIILKSRLDLLGIGMSRARVLEILDLSSISARSYASANTTGITYHIETGHTLQLGMQKGDYDSTFRWANFDGETWPKNYAPNQSSPKPETN